MSCICIPSHAQSFHFFFFNDTATTEIYTLSLHDALPISTCLRHLTVWPRSWSKGGRSLQALRPVAHASSRQVRYRWRKADRKSTRLNSSHQIISYAVFCLKKKR